MDKLVCSQRGQGGGSASKTACMWSTYVFATVFCIQVLQLGQLADAGPILASSQGHCRNITLKRNDGEQLVCCLPQSKKRAERFVLPTVTSLRERKPAHELAQDPEYVSKYNLAYARMKNLSDDDPRSLLNQWHIHCSFCNEAFNQRSTPYPKDEPTGQHLQIHYSWTFLPWHRMLIYFHEKILGKLIGDPDFALPFWNWDNHLPETNANWIPSMFLADFLLTFANGTKVNNSQLVNANRNPAHFPGKALPLAYDAEGELNGMQNLTDQEIIDGNLNTIWNDVVNQISSERFLGGPYRSGTNHSTSTVPEGKSPGISGSAEELHNPVHEWVGLYKKSGEPDNPDMGNFIFAGRDPMFYTHHANMDRFWDVWKTLSDTTTPGGDRKRMDSNDTDFLNTEFTFYDENGDMVIVTVNQTLDSGKLGYSYQDMSESDKLWIEHQPKNTTSASGTMNTVIWEPSDCPEVDPNANNFIGDSPLCLKLPRRAPTEEDLKGTQVNRVDQLSEGIIVEGVQIPHGLYVHLDLYIDDPGADRTTDIDLSDYIGTFSHLASGIATEAGEDEEYELFDIQFTTGVSLKRLGITDYNLNTTVTIVPKFRESNVTIKFRNIIQQFQ